MKPLQCVLVAIVLLLSARTSHGAEPPSQAAQTGDLDTMLIEYAEAATKFYDGQPDAVKEFWSHEDDVTLSGAAGGETAKGWTDVSARLDWASSQFSKGSKEIELIQKTARGDFAYVVQYEHIRFHPPGKPAQSKRDYRVTTIFRREPEGWRVVHRHADTLMTRQAVR